MPPTNQQLYEIQVSIARRLVTVNELLLSTINKQHSIEKFLLKAIPGLPPEWSAQMLDGVAGSDTIMEHLEAELEHFRETVRMFAELK